MSLNEQMREAARELAEYTSYAEIVGGVTRNRELIRTWCDRVFEIERAFRAEEDKAHLDSLNKSG